MFEHLAQYKILDRIGAGGMGEVYRARDTRLGRTVAVKVLAADVADDPERRDRFLREARASAALSHPNIAALYEIGEDRGQLFLAFEFVPGETLKTVIGGQPLNPRRAIDLAVQMADALADAHASGIVHRDIKPGNVIVTPKGNAKILDFGLATWTAGGAEREQAADAAMAMATGAGTTLGTVAYKSPEQALGEPVDHRTDIFSLGIVLFEMLTGHRPFSGPTATALALEIVQAEAPAPSTVNRSVPRELDATVAKALAKSLEERYESAASLAADLRSVAAGLDARTEAGVAATAPAGAASSRRSHVRSIFLPVILPALLVAVMAAAIWIERDPLQRYWRRATSPAPSPVIAVIPLELGNDDGSNKYFADGLTEDLITRLGQTPGLKVMGRSATRDYRGQSPRDVARELDAGVVLTGSVRPAGDTVKVSLELIDPSDGTVIWSSQYTRDMKDIFAVQAQVAEDVATALRVQLLPTAARARVASRLVDPRAYELYLRGRAAMTERRLVDAMALYEQAIAADSGLAEAYADFVEAMELDTINGAPLDAARRRKRNDAAARAYQLDPDLPQANLAMGLAADALSQALGYMRRAVELDPSYSEGFHQIADHIADFDPERALLFYQRSIALDPRLEVNRIEAALTLLVLNRPGEARRLIDEVRTELVPGWRDYFQASVDVDDRRLERAIDRLRRSPVRNMEVRQRMATNVDTVARLWYAIVLQTAGHADEAFREVSEAVGRSPDYCLARALLAGLSLQRGRAAAAHRLADPIMRAARHETAAPDAVRCGVAAAAAMNDATGTAELLDRVSASEELLRYWALWVGHERGGHALRGRYYPWTNIVGKSPVVDARQRLEAAYTRERDVARKALAGLLDR